MSFEPLSTNDDPGQESDDQTCPTNESANDTGQPAPPQEQEPTSDWQAPPPGQEPLPASTDSTWQVRRIEVEAEDPTEAAEAPAQQAPQPAVATQEPPAKRKLAISFSPRTKRLLTFVLAGAAIGVAGYLIVPRRASSATPTATETTLEAMRFALASGKAVRNKLQEQLSATRQELAQTQEQAAQVAAAEKNARAKVTVAEKFIAKLNQELAQANTANEPMRKQVAAAQKQASQSQSQAAQAAAQAGRLQRELADATKLRDQYAAAGKQLQAERAKLQKDLSIQQKTGAELIRLLEALDLGQPPAKAPDQAKDSSIEPLPEMPITIEELTCSMGQPTLTIQADQELTLHWGQQHSARAVNGVADTIDEKPATRALLEAAAGATPAVAAAPGPWRAKKDSPLHYADLVAMFGQPQCAAGTGRQFTAWWPVGAWARTVSAKVVDGVVTEFDGRRADPAQICALVYQRAQAYTAGQSANWEAKVQANTDLAKACYGYVAEMLLPHRLAKEAELKARDGLKLTNWVLAPFDSVGTWIAPTSAPAGSICLRAAVDCTWTAMDGAATTQRRYMVVTLTREQGIIRPTAIAIFDPRD